MWKKGKLNCPRSRANITGKAKSNVLFIELIRTFSNLIELHGSIKFEYNRNLPQKHFSKRTQSNFDWVRLGHS